MIEETIITDRFRELNPDKKKSTWRKTNPTKLATLDMFLISTTCLPSLESRTIKYGYRSDHSILILTLTPSSFNKGRGLWKFNNSLVGDLEYINRVKQIVLEVKKQNGLPNSV